MSAECVSGTFDSQKRIYEMLRSSYEFHHVLIFCCTVMLRRQSSSPQSDISSHWAFETSG